jgi:LTXXQ motif family protein
MSFHSIASKSSRIAVALLASVAVAALTLPDAASAAGRGGGGGGGFHGGGGGGFHMGGGGGGFHMGGGGFHTGGGGFRAGGFHGGGFAVRGGGPSFATHGFAGRSFGGRGAFAGRGFVGRGQGGRLATGRALTTTHNGLAAHAAVGAAAGLNAHGQFTHNQSAHQQFAAQNFHGLHDFNRAGFNRNAFGDGHDWNRWGGRFWGAGWNRWGGGWGGWAGPVFWPYLYGDIFSFAFWPDDYYDPFWAFGPDFVLGSIFAPGPYLGAGYGYAPSYGEYGVPQVYYGTTSAERRTIAQTEAAAAESCGGLAPGVTSLPIAQIKKTVQPTGDQAAALDELSAATAKANGVVKASCPTATPLTPVARLDAAQGRLEAMIQAVQIVSGPLEKFYASLTDEQKKKFDAMGSADRAAESRGATSPGGNLAALCGEQSSDVGKLPVQRIEQVVQPTAQQQAAFDALKQASEDTAQELQASCPAQAPQTPVARLEAVNKRLNAIVEAMKAVRPKLQDFYASLSDEQKAAFNTMGPPPQSASSSPAQRSNAQ